MPLTAIAMIPYMPTAHADAKKGTAVDPTPLIDPVASASARGDGVASRPAAPSCESAAPFSNKARGRTWRGIRPA